MEEGDGDTESLRRELERDMPKAKNERVMFQDHNWRKYRLGKKNKRLGASEVGPAIGLSRHRSPRMVYDTMVKRKHCKDAEEVLKMEEEELERDLNDPEREEYTRKRIQCLSNGHIKEPITKSLYEKITSNLILEGNYWEFEEEWLRDLVGYSNDGKIIYNYTDRTKGYMISMRPSGYHFDEFAEIKNAENKMYDGVKDEHMAQVQIGCKVMNNKLSCQYIVTLMDISDPKNVVKKGIKIWRIKPNALYQKWMTDRLFQFSRAVQSEDPRQLPEIIKSPQFVFKESVEEMEI